MAKKYSTPINTQGQEKRERFLEEAKAHLWACWRLPILERRYNETCNRCKYRGSCKGCPVEDWKELIELKIQSGKYPKQTALAELRRLDTDAAIRLHERLTRPHSTVIHYGKGGEIIAEY